MKEFETEEFLVERLYENHQDLTNFNFADSSLYICKTDTNELGAYRLDYDEILTQPWGIQDMKAGDWVVLKPSSKSGGFKKSGVKQEAFNKTYIDLGNGRYKKESFIRAEKIDQPYKFLGVDSDELEFAPAGSYLVLNLDKNQEPIIINGRRDIFFYKEDDLVAGYELVE